MNQQHGNVDQTDDRAFCERIRQRLDNGTVLTAGIQARLRHARQSALARGESEARNGLLAFDLTRLWRPVASFASVAALAVTVVYLGSMEAQYGVDLAATESDVELLLSADDLELYQNLEFYAWLASASE